MEWKKNIFCVLAISLSTFNSLAQSQNISLNLLRRDIVLTDPVSSTIYLASRTKTPNSYPIQTLNGEIIRSYSIYKFLLQPKPDLSKYDPVSSPSIKYLKSGKAAEAPGKNCNPAEILNLLFGLIYLTIFVHVHEQKVPEDNSTMDSRTVISFGKRI
ncbi:MAG: hypothetical protein JST10_00735 [Bacteroidetes bacterium]|nr:hypothetical protein [Bacteroidota bacterium]MBS1631076.1 hypothetical protein [Bacteroidota bacterium]